MLLLEPIRLGIFLFCFATRWSSFTVFSLSSLSSHRLPVSVFFFSPTCESIPTTMRRRTSMVGVFLGGRISSSVLFASNGSSSRPVGSSHLLKEVLLRIGIRRKRRSETGWRILYGETAPPRRVLGKPMTPF